MDCTHPVVDLDSHFVEGMPTLTYTHWFTCDLCNVKAVIVERVASEI